MRAAMQACKVGAVEFVRDVEKRNQGGGRTLAGDSKTYNGNRDMADTQLKDLEADANRAAGRDKDALSDQVEVLRRDLASITEILSEMGVRRKDETVAAARARYERMRGEGEARWHDAQNRAHEAQDELLATIRRQPGTALGVAIGAGFLAGLIFGRK